MKTAIITGASRGIGLATAQKFLAEGWFVIGTSTSGKVPITDKNFIPLQADYFKSETIISAVENIKKLNKKIDVLVNNAAIGIEEIGSPLRVDLLRQIVEVNVIGTADMTVQLMPLLNNPSHIVNISSMASSLTDPIEDGWYVPAYKISKTAINMFTRVMGEQLKSQGVIVSALDPGWVRTDMGGPGGERAPEEAAEDIYKLAISKVPTGKLWLEGKERNW